MKPDEWVGRYLRVLGAAPKDALGLPVPVQFPALRPADPTPDPDQMARVRRGADTLPAAALISVRGRRSVQSRAPTMIRVRTSEPHETAGRPRPFRTPCACRAAAVTPCRAMATGRNRPCVARPECPVRAPALFRPVWSARCLRWGHNAHRDPVAGSRSGPRRQPGPSSAKTCDLAIWPVSDTGRAR